MKEEKEIKEKIEDWEIELGLLITRAWQKGLWHSESNLLKDIKDFLRTALQEARDEVIRDFATGVFIRSREAEKFRQEILKELNNQINDAKIN